ncbi:Spherulin-4 [Orbilia brochopaga]|nr:Spherulin-4 [Drechslerella brochopaga]
MDSLLRCLAAPFSCCASRAKYKPSPPANSRGVSILFPLYIYPDLGCWDRVLTAVSQHPEQHFTFVINPNSGPGSENYPDAEYIDAIAKLNVYKNVTLIGYVHASYGTRDPLQIISEIARYAAWSSHPEVDIHVSGIFVDEAPGELGDDRMHLEYMELLFCGVKRAFASVGLQGYLITNPGKIVDKAFYKYADSIVCYEAAFKTMMFPDTLFTSIDRRMSPGTPAARQGVLVHSFDGGRRQQGELVRMLVDQGVGEVYVTTCDPKSLRCDYFGPLIGWTNAWKPSIRRSLNRLSRVKDRETILVTAVTNRLGFRVALLTAPGWWWPWYNYFVGPGNPAQRRLEYILLLQHRPFNPSTFTVDYDFNIATSDTGVSISIESTRSYLPNTVYTAAMHAPWAPASPPSQRDDTRHDERKAARLRKRAYVKIEEWEPYKEFVLQLRHDKMKEKDIINALKQRGFVVE